jgi:hypothetical protein
MLFKFAESNEKPETHSLHTKMCLVVKGKIPYIQSHDAAHKSPQVKACTWEIHVPLINPRTSFALATCALVWV